MLILPPSVRIYLAAEPVDMRRGHDGLAAIVHTMKVLTWDGTGTIVVYKKLDPGRFELPRAMGAGEQHVIVSDAIFDVIHKGVAITPRAARQRSH